MTMKVNVKNALKFSLLLLVLAFLYRINQEALIVAIVAFYIGIVASEHLHSIKLVNLQKWGLLSMDYNDADYEELRDKKNEKPLP